MDKVIPSPPLASRLAAIFDLVRHELYWRTPARVARHPLLGALLLIATARMRHILRRFERLLTLWAAGIAPGRAARPRSTPPARIAAPSTLRPTGPRWLPDIVPETIIAAHAIEQLLADPALQEFARATPQAGRLLRPLCRMFGASIPAWLALPRRAAPAIPRPPRPRPAPHRSSDPPHLRLRVPGIDARLPKNWRVA